MKKVLLAGVVAMVAGVLVGPSIASADTTTTTPTVPTDCWVDFNLAGPSRVTHAAPAVVSNTYAGPDCGEVPAICVTVNYPDGGQSRAVHGRPALPAQCTPLGPACNISVNFNDYAHGPARVVHQPSAPARPAALSGGVVDIPADCEELMVLALTPTGSNTAPTIWIATAFLGAGAVLILAPRRLARR